jgi:hypothetical protein
VKIDFNYIFLRKGLYLETIQIQLTEIHQATLLSSRLLPDLTIREMLIQETKFKHERCNDIQVTDGYGQWSYFSGLISMPKSAECRTTSSSSIMKISHKLKINIEVRNPDGHISMVSID